MARYEINVEVGTKSNGKPDRRRLVEHASNERDAEAQAAPKIAKYGESAQIISVYAI